MAKTSTRKLFLFGRYSLALLLPKKWLTELGIEAGSTVKLEFDRARKRIIVRLEAQTPSTGPNNSKTKKESGWQPIPQL